MIIGARITGLLDLQAATVTIPLRLRKCHVEGSLDLSDATVKVLDLSGSHLPAGWRSDGVTVNRNVNLHNGFTAKGEARLVGAEISGNLECDGSTFVNEGGNALNADGMTVKGGVYLRNSFTGEVRLLGADIAGNLDCRKGTFENEGNGALSADRMSVKGGVYLRHGFRAKGAVRLINADIGGNLDCLKGTFESEGGNALIADGASIKGKLIWSAVASTGMVDLQHAKVGQLVDDAESWPDADWMVLDGLKYGSIAWDSPTTAQERREWLGRQPRKAGFSPQPYEHLVRVLRQMGHERDARDIAIEKQRALRKHGNPTWVGRQWDRFLDWTVAYGHRPWQAIWSALSLIIFGSLVFGLANFFDVMGPARPGDFRNWVNAPDGEADFGSYPPFLAPVYSLDVFLPIVDLHQESYWLPKRETAAGRSLWLYMWFHILGRLDADFGPGGGADGAGQTRLI